MNALLRCALVGLAAADDSGDCKHGHTKLDGECVRGILGSFSCSFSGSIGVDQSLSEAPQPFFGRRLALTLPAITTHVIVAAAQVGDPCNVEESIRAPRHGSLGTCGKREFEFVHLRPNPIDESDISVKSLAGALGTIGIPFKYWDRETNFSDGAVFWTNPDKVSCAKEPCKKSDIIPAYGGPGGMILRGRLGSKFNCIRRGRRETKNRGSR
jgi:hypothetical protein